MPQIKAALGHVKVETAKRKRGCSRHKNGRHKHDIAKGEACLVITDVGGGGHNYCVGSAEEILDRVQDDLNDLRARLGLKSRATTTESSDETSPIHNCSTRRAPEGGAHARHVRDALADQSNFVSAAASTPGQLDALHRRSGL